MTQGAYGDDGVPTVTRGVYSDSGVPLMTRGAWGDKECLLFHLKQQNPQ